MAIPAHKDELIAAIHREFARLNARIDALPAVTLTAHASSKTMAGHAKGTMMSLNDLLAYLIGWNELVIKWLNVDASGNQMALPEVGYKWNQLGALAQKFYLDYEGLAFSEKRMRLAAAKAGILAKLDGYSNARLYGAPWHGKHTLGRMVQLNTAAPYKNADGRIRDWAKSQG